MLRRPHALITGASRGIGAHVARALASTHQLWLGGRDQVALQEVLADLPDAQPWLVDLADVEALAAAVPPIEKLDLLVHSAGVVELGSVAETSPQTWRHSYNINVVAAAELTRLLLPALRSANGTVVFINSGAGLRANPNWAAYAASKFALKALADALRAEEQANGVRVTTIYPGRVATDMQRKVRLAEKGAFEPERYLDPQSIADAVLMAANLPRNAQLYDLTIRPSDQGGLFT